MLSFHEGSLFYEAFEMAPVSLAELKNSAHTVFGDPGSQLPFDIGVDEISGFLHTNINSYWKKWMEDHSSWTKKKSLLYLFPRLTEWSVLGVGRQLFTLDKKKIVSKLTAGQYCLQTFPEKYHPIISEAIAIRQDKRRYPFVGSYALRPSVRRMDQTLECMHFTISRFNELWEKGPKQKE